MSLVWVALGGAAGSVLRVLAVRLPLVAGSLWGVFLINVLGSFLIGLLWAVLGARAPSSPIWGALGVGALGGFTTYSSYSLEVMRLIEAGRLGTAALYAGGTLVVAVAGCWAGLALGRSL